LLNLATCYERAGKTASAWVIYTEVASVAKKAGQRRRANHAKFRAKVLKPKLSKMTLKVAEPVEGLVVLRGKEEVSEQLWGTAVPVDPGEYEIKAEAPEKKPWSDKVTVGEKADEVTVEVPALEDAPKPKVEEPKPEPKAEPKDKPQPVDDGSNVQGIVGWLTAGVGVAGLGVGTAMRILALSMDDESLGHCQPTDPTLCDPDGVDLRDQARTFQTLSIVGWAAGGALVATGVVLILTAPSGPDDDASSAQGRIELAPSIAPGHAGAILRGSF
jgi:hypothetical protein